MSKTTSNSRRQRRAQMRNAGMLKDKNKNAPLSKKRQEWYKSTMQNGKDAQEKFQKKVNDSKEEQLQNILNRVKKTWQDIGHNENECQKLEEAFTILAVNVDDNVAKEEQKEARRLMLEARTDMQKRLQ